MSSSELKNLTLEQLLIQLQAASPGLEKLRTIVRRDGRALQARATKG